MKKSLLFVILCLIALLLLPDVACADVEEDLNDAIDEQIGNLDFSDLETFADGNLVTSIVAKVKAVLDGEYDSAETFLQFLLDVFFDGLKNVVPSLATVFAIAVLCSILMQKNSFVSSGTANLIYFAGFAVVLVSLLGILYTLYRSVYAVTDRLSLLTDAALPIMLTLMTAGGNVVSAKVYQPMVAMLSVTVMKIVRVVLLPLCALSLVFGIVSNLSDNIKVSKMSQFFTEFSSWLLGAVFMVFMAFLSVEGITAATSDGVSVRAAKFATKNYIPLLGGYLADGFDLIVAGGTLIKNAFGVVTLLLAAAILLTPVTEILIYKFGLQAVAAFAEPVCDKKFVSLFSQIGKNLTFLALLPIAVGFMFLLLVSLAIYTANVVL